MQRLIYVLLVTFGLLGTSGAFAAEPPATAPAVYDMSALDKKPLIHFRAKPEYPAKLKAAGITGEVVISLVIDTQGDVKDVKVIGSTRIAFEEAAVAAVRKWKFRPGRKDGRPVNTRATVTIPFRRN